MDLTRNDPAEQDRSLLETVSQQALGRRPARIERVEAGLGARRFYRLHFFSQETSQEPSQAPRTLIGRIEDEAPAPGADPRPNEPQPPSWLAEPPLEPIRSLLEAAGLPVPRSHAHRPECGVDLLEDVGDRTLLDASGEDRVRLYREAAGLVIGLQRIGPGKGQAEAFSRRFDRRLLESKAWKWLHWAIPGLLGRAASASERDATQAAFEAIAQLVEDAPLRLAHRDFKAENLHLVAQRPGGPEHLVMIDIQGAFMAPPEYDLVCLLDDLQTDLDPALAAEIFETTRAALPDAPDPETSRLRFDALATARLCKDVAHVVHAGRQRGDTRRWHEIPRGLSLLESAAGRLEHTFPAFRALTCVIPALTAAARSSDIAHEGVGRSE